MISLLCLHRFLLDKGLVDFIVVMHNRYTVQCKLHRFIFNFLLVRTTSRQIVSRYCCALKPSLRIFATVDYRKNKFVSWLENFVCRLCVRFMLLVTRYPVTPLKSQRHLRIWMAINNRLLNQKYGIFLSKVSLLCLFLYIL